MLIFQQKICKLHGMVVVNDSILICTDSGEGKVYEYNTEDNSTMMVLQGLRLPTYISVDHTPQCTRYILTLGAMLFANGSLKIYNESWQLLTTTTQDINNPSDCQDQGYL